MKSLLLHCATVLTLTLGTTATGIVAVATSSWVPMLVGYPLTLVGAGLLFWRTLAAIGRDE